MLLTSCGPDDKVVAKVGNSQLFEGDVIIMMKHQGKNVNNKMEFDTFVREWCETEAFKNEMKVSYPNEWNLIRLRAESFSGELARYYIEENALKKKLDTLVTEEDIQTYYISHKDEFVLHDYIVKALYFKIPKSLDFKKDKIQESFLLKNDKDLSKIDSYAKLYAENYYFNDSTWEYFEKIVHDIPATNYNIDNIVLNRTKTYISDENYTYFINIIDFKLKDEAPPVEFLRNEIKSIIVSNRLQDLKIKSESTLIQSIKEKHEIIISD